MAMPRPMAIYMVMVMAKAMTMALTMAAMAMAKGQGHGHGHGRPWPWIMAMDLGIGHGSWPWILATTMAMAMAGWRAISLPSLTTAMTKMTAHRLLFSLDEMAQTKWLLSGSIVIRFQLQPQMMQSAHGRCNTLIGQRLLQGRLHHSRAGLECPSQIRHIGLQLFP